MEPPPSCPQCGQPMEPTRGGRFWYCSRCKRSIPIPGAFSTVQVGTCWRLWPALSWLSHWVTFNATSEKAGAHNIMVVGSVVF